MATRGDSPPAPPSADAVEAWIAAAERPWPRVVLRLVRATMGLLYRFLGRLRIEGVEHVPRSGPVLLAPNHVSASDWPAVGVAAPRSLWFMAKAELFDMPILGPLIRCCRAFPVHRDTSDRAALRLTETLIRRGAAVVIFPEGRVSEDARLQPLKHGLALVALRTGAPIVPVALLGTERLLPCGVNVPRRVREPVIVRFGAPVRLDDLREEGRAVPSREAIETATGRVEAALRRLITESRSGASESA